MEEITSDEFDSSQSENQLNSDDELNLQTPDRFFKSLRKLGRRDSGITIINPDEAYVFISDITPQRQTTNDTLRTDLGKLDIIKTNLSYHSINNINHINKIPSVTAPIPNTTKTTYNPPNVEVTIPNATIPNYMTTKNNFRNVTAPIPNTIIPNYMDMTTKNNFPNATTPIPNTTIPNYMDMTTKNYFPNVTAPIPNTTIPNYMDMNKNNFLNATTPTNKINYRNVPAISNTLTSTNVTTKNNFQNVTAPIPNTTTPNYMDMTTKNNFSNVTAPIPNTTIPNYMDMTTKNNFSNVTAPIPNTTTPHYMDMTTKINYHNVSVISNYKDMITKNNFQNVTAPIPNATTPNYMDMTTKNNFSNATSSIPNTTIPNYMDITTKNNFSNFTSSIPNTTIPNYMDMTTKNNFSNVTPSIPNTTIPNYMDITTKINFSNFTSSIPNTTIPNYMDMTTKNNFPNVTAPIPNTITPNLTDICSPEKMDIGMSNHSSTRKHLRGSGTILDLSIKKIRKTMNIDEPEICYQNDSTDEEDEGNILSHLTTDTSGINFRRNIKYSRMLTTQQLCPKGSNTKNQTTSSITSKTGLKNNDHNFQIPFLRTTSTSSVPELGVEPALLKKSKSYTSISSSQVDCRNCSTPREDKIVKKSDGIEEDLERLGYLESLMSLQEYGVMGNTFLVINDKEKKFFSEPLSSKLIKPKLINVRDIYDEKFFGKVHLNFIGIHNTKKDEYCIVSVLKRAENGKYQSLKTHKKGYDIFTINAKSLKQQNERKKNLAELVEDYLNETEKDMSYYFTQDNNFPQDLRQVEIKHSQRHKTMKIAFLYSVGTETVLQHFFDHKTANPAYFEFLEILGQRINLIGWKKYRGDIGVEVEQDSYYTEWKGIEIMFHICLWMNAEQHRRLIGNDVVFVIFHDTNSPFDPAPLDALGTVPQVFGVVQKNEDNYRIGFFSRPNIKPYYPPVPENFCFNHEGLKDFLFTKVYNGYCQALSCPPMNRLFEVPRASSIKEMVSKYPRESKSDRRIRDQGQKKLRELITTSIKDPLLLLGTVVRCLSQREISNPHVYVRLLEQEHRTKNIKGKHLEMEWNDTFCFNVLAVDPTLHFVKLEVREGNKLSSVIIGQAEISFRQICDSLCKDIWVELDSEVSSDVVVGMICLRFKLKGPASQLCPKCNLFLGSTDLILYKDVKYHAHCFTCATCNKKLLSKEEFKVICERNYCGKCFGKLDISEFRQNSNTPEDESGLVVISERKNIEGDSQHNWEAATFRFNSAFCGFCGEFLKLGGHGFQCTDCKYPCHKQCKEQVPNNCSHDPKTQVWHSKGFLQSSKPISGISMRKSGPGRQRGNKELSPRSDLPTLSPRIPPNESRFLSTSSRERSSSAPEQPKGAIHSVPLPEDIYKIDYQSENKKMDFEKKNEEDTITNMSSNNHGGGGARKSIHRMMERKLSVKKENTDPTKQIKPPLAYESNQTPLEKNTNTIDQDSNKSNLSTGQRLRSLLPIATNIVKNVKL